jgi:hypothetical protein
LPQTRFFALVTHENKRSGGVIAAAKKMETATATTTTAIANSVASAAAGQYFPNSMIVMDMALISHAVYKLKDRVGSCDDA